MKTFIPFLAASVAAFPPACQEKPAGEPPFAVTGLSTQTDLQTAAKEAAQSMMSQFKAAGKKPGAVIFLERVDNPGHAGFREKVGDIVKAESGGAPTFGHGDCGSYGITWGPVKDKTSTFLVLGLAAPDLQVTGYVTGGAIEYSYVDPNRPKDSGKVQAWEKEIEREKKLVEDCRNRGKALGIQIPRLKKPGLVLLLGALHNHWHTFFAEGLREAIGPEVPVVGGVGKWGDYVYNDGQAFKDKNGKPTSVGQIAILIQGDISINLSGKQADDTWNREKVMENFSRISKNSLDKPNGGKPFAVLAFSCVTLLRDSKIMDPEVPYGVLKTNYGGNIPIFGCFCGGEFGFDVKSKFSTGGNRFMVAVLSAKQ